MSSLLKRIQDESQNQLKVSAEQTVVPSEPTTSQGDAQNAESLKTELDESD